jgi:short subunit dehydrogenase-like uncharacterized protein
MTKTWMLYGANGLTGALIAREAARRGHACILAGRNAGEIETLGRALGLPTRVFPVSSEFEVRRHIAGLAAVLHCAGPFSATSAPMLDACLAAGAHYLDITGEMAVFERVHARTREIAAAGISAIPGVGFDVVGSDCLAAMLKRDLPDAVTLRLGMQWVGGRMSKGTIKSMAESVPHGGMIRRDGKLTPVPSGWKVRRIPFQRGKSFWSVSIPWGDVSTAFYSTGIPNIEFYWARSLPEIAAMRAVNPVRGLLGKPAVQSFVAAAIERVVRGPTDGERERAESYVWGEAENAAGKRVARRMRLPEGYTFTYLAALASLERVLAGGVTPGALTPSMAFGADFALTIPGVRVEEI